MAAARAVWQRTANRLFIQEDAKRAPKLACCPSTSSLLSIVDTKLDHITYMDESFDLFNEKYPNSNPSSDSTWWLQSQPDYMHQRGLTLTSEEVNSHQFIESQDGSIKDSMSKDSYELVEMDSVELPWWKMAERDDFSLFVSKKSLDMKENSDLFPILKPEKSKCSQNAVSREPKIDLSKSKILEALCHSQTRARVAENAAKMAYKEKERVIKLLLKQASQLFAYKQWIYLLQLENIVYQFHNNNINMKSSKGVKSHRNLKKVPPVKGKRTRIKRGFGHYKHNIQKYAAIFVVGLGIVGAGLFFGWTVGWMLI